MTALNAAGSDGGPTAPWSGGARQRHDRAEPNGGTACWAPILAVSPSARAEESVVSDKGLHPELRAVFASLRTPAEEWRGYHPRHQGPGISGIHLQAPDTPNALSDESYRFRTR